MKIRDLEKMLKEAGAVYLRSSGSHDIWRLPSGKNYTVVNNGKDSDVAFWMPVKLRRLLRESIPVEVPQGTMSVELVSPPSSIVTNHPVEHVLAKFEFPESEPPASVPAEETKEEAVVAKYKETDYTELSLLLAGLPPGPYRSHQEIVTEANRYREIVGLKKACLKHSALWSYGGLVRALGEAVKAGIITGSKNSGWSIVHDPKVKLTLIHDVPDTERPVLSPRVSTIREYSGDTPIPSMNGFHLALPDGMMERMGAKVVATTTGIDAAHAAKLIENGYIPPDRWRQAAEKWAVEILENLLK